MELAQRFRELDALRGLAAAWVALSHISSAGQWIGDALHPLVRFTPLRLLSQPHVPVIFFFVLSGFVLHRSIATRHDSYPAYAARRFTRIYMPYAASLIFAACGMLLFANPAVTAGASDPDWADLSLATLAGHFAMTGTRLHSQLNGVIWSLIHEMRISLILPFLSMVFTRSILAGALVGLAVSLMGFAILLAAGQTQFYFPNTAILAIPMSMFYVAPFAVGIATSEIVQRNNARTLLIGAVLCVGLCFVLFRLLGLNYTGLSDYIVATAAGAVIALSVSSSRLSATLTTAPLQNLGRISYSLYLFHLPVMLIMIHSFHGRATPAWVMVATVPIVAAVAAIAHRYVEAPSIRLSRAAGRWCNARFAGPRSQAQPISGTDGLRR